MPGRIERRHRAGATNTRRGSNVTPERTAAAPMMKDTSTPTGDIDIHNEITMIMDSPVQVQQVQNQPPRARNPTSNAVAVPNPVPREQGQNNQVQAPALEGRRRRDRRRHVEGGGILAAGWKFLMGELMESSSDNDSDVMSQSCSSISCSCSECQEEDLAGSSSSSDCDCDWSNCVNTASS